MFIGTKEMMEAAWAKRSLVSPTRRARWKEAGGAIAGKEGSFTGMVPQPPNLRPRYKRTRLGIPRRCNHD